MQGGVDQVTACIFSICPSLRNRIVEIELNREHSESFVWKIVENLKCTSVKKVSSTCKKRKGV